MSGDRTHAKHAVWRPLDGGVSGIRATRGRSGGVVLGVELPWLDEVVQAKASRRLPAVLTPREVRGVLRPLDAL